MSFKKINFLSLDFSLIVLSLLIVSGVGIRSFLLDKHFCTYDDLCVADIIVKTSKPKPFLSEYKNPSSPSYNHFSSIIKRKLDCLGEIGLGVKKAFVIPFLTTYAPFQFIFTSVLINPHMDYGELVKYGRFPSFVFGISSFFLIIHFYRILNDNRFFVDAWIPLCLVVFSWQHIIYSVQMESYAIGVFSVFFLFFLLIQWMDEDVFTLKKGLFLGICLGFLTYTQYQLVFFIPPFFIILFLLSYRKKTLYAACKEIFLVSLPFLILFGFLYFIFLRHKTHLGVTSWNAGCNKEFLFIFTGSGCWDFIIYFISFFSKNIFIIFRGMLSFTPLGLSLTHFFTVFFIFTAFLGCSSFLRDKNIKKRYLGFFFVLCSIVYVVLIVLGKITFGPTRHSMVLIPFLVVLISEGFYSIFFHLGKSFSSLYHYGCLIFAFCIMGSFYYYSSFIINQRRDPFDPQSIKKILDIYSVDAVICTDYTINLNLMPSIYQKYPILVIARPGVFFDKKVDLRTKKPSIMPPSRYKNIAIVSNSFELSSDIFGKIIRDTNFLLAQPLFFDDNMNHYRFLYQENRPSSVGVCFDPCTAIGFNGLFITILNHYE